MSSPNRSTSDIEDAFSSMARKELLTSSAGLNVPNQYFLVASVPR
ncbi:hypothetical protein Tco_0602716, partial [Tanacetum coccineum]